MASQYEIRDGRLFGHPAKRIEVGCSHGATTFFLLPGSDAGANAAAIDLLLTRHGIRRSCGCATPDPDMHRRRVPAGAEQGSARATFTSPK